jgi:hypothetical protein
VQLGVGVSLLPPPRPVLPEQILQALIAAPVKARAKVHQALRRLDSAVRMYGARVFTANT